MNSDAWELAYYLGYDRDMINNSDANDLYDFFCYMAQQSEMRTKEPISRFKTLLQEKLEPFITNDITI